MRRRLDLAVLALAAGLCGAAFAAADAEPLLRHRAPISVERDGAFVQLPLPVSAYARTQQASLADLRVQDARGENVPFALLAPRPDEAQRSERLTERALFALPPRPVGSESWPTPLELTVEGERISVRRRPGGTAPPTRPPGWVIDLGDPAARPAGEPAPQALDLSWSGPAEFSVGYRLEQSDDLRQWRPAGAGQILALAAPEGALTQPRVPLTAAPARFQRLVWSDPAAAPALTAARSVTVDQRAVVLDEPTELQLAASPEPAPREPQDAAPPRSLHFDLGAVLPLVQVDLALPPGTQVAPVRLQGRERVDQPWQALAGAVFYRIDRDGTLTRSPPLALQQRVRYLRVVPDPRAGALDAGQTRLVVRAQLVSLVFAAQGQPPYALLAGSAQAHSGALPLATLVPAPEAERPRFGRASLGDWAESAEAVRRAEADERRDALRRWLLWTVLLGGVGALGWMVWRLARGAAAPVQ
ncbi:MAG: DUF3999 family protein [Piscinibacter sp.]|nr:DUF3999 family protein [Piscinibacter sp.]